jgi:C_GCAxxG_C_C family probable redox protein
MDDLHFRMLELSGKGYCCSQIMFIMALELQGRENPDLVRAMAGLCHGIGFSGNTCGALTGAACLLAYYAGKGADSEQNGQGYATMLTELAFWFKEEIGTAHGGVTCAEILIRNPDRLVCKDIVLATYGRTMELLAEQGYDPAE